MNRTHGVVGANLFLAVYVLAVLGPLVRVLPGASPLARAGVLAMVAVSALVTVLSIRAHGGGGLGELLGVVAGVLAWLGRSAGPFVASALAAAVPDADLWRLVGASLPPALIAMVYGMVHGRRGGSQP